MPGAGRLGDKAQVQGPGCAHGCPACPHPATGPAIVGSPDVFINSKFALRVDDMGMHAVCCGMNMWTAKMGAPFVNINGKKAYRKDDMGQSCGGMTKLIEGSADVIVGSSGGGGGAGGAGSGMTGANDAITAGAAGSGGGSSSGQTSSPPPSSPPPPAPPPPATAEELEEQQHGSPEPNPAVESAQAQTLKAAAKAGLPFCEKCSAKRLAAQAHTTRSWKDQAETPVDPVVIVDAKDLTEAAAAGVPLCEKCDAKRKGDASGAN